MIISHNLLAMNAQRQFNISTNKKKKTTEKLSSGYKINRAADDAAGLTISEKLRRQIRGLDQGARNTQDGISLLQVADGALNEVHDMLHRMNELAIKAANGTNSETDREAIQQEVVQLKNEIGDICQKTSYNENYIFRGDERTLKKETDKYINVDLTGVVSSARDYGTYIQLVVYYGTEEHAGGDHNFHIPLNGEEYYVGYNMQEVEELCKKYNYGYIAFGDRTESNDDNYYGLTNLHDYTITEGDDGNLYYYNTDDHQQYRVAECGLHEYGHVGGIKVRFPGYTPIKILLDSNGDGIDDIDSHLVNRAGFVALTMDEIKKKYAQTGAFSEPQIEHIKTEKRRGQEFYKLYKPKAAKYEKEIEDKKIWIQSGAEKDDGMTLTIPHIDDEVIGVGDISVLDESSAKLAIDKVDMAIKKISEMRSSIGAQQNRLEHTYKNVTNIAENTQAAESRIRDTDMAKEMVEMSKHNILEQVGTSMIAQANQSNQGVLNLLQ